jgi:hypothetical protein
MQVTHQIKTVFFIGFCFLFLLTDGYTQSFVFGPKIGPSLGFQRWSNYPNRGALISYHGAFFIESYQENEPSSLYVEAGFHRRGSTEFRTFNATSVNSFRARQAYVFNNVNLIAGAKRIINMEKSAKPYYILGVRAEYTLSTNLEQYSQFVPWTPAIELVNNFNYGFTVGGGYQFDFSELFGGAIEVSIHPDISKQYDQPPLNNVINPWDPGNPRSLPQQQIRNLSLEISAVLRLKRIVEYI